MEESSFCQHAASKVLRTPELLTIILSYVSCKRTLLLSQRVSRLFRAIITESRVIQHLLFFLAVPQSTSSIRTRLVNSDGLEDERSIRDVQLNPLLVRAFPNFFPKSPIKGRREDFASLEWASNPARAAAFTSPEASWRRMLLSDPPPEEATLDWCICNIFKSGIRGRVGCVPINLKSHGDDVRMGFLYDLVEEWVVEKTRVVDNGFIIKWGWVEPLTDEERLLEEMNWKQGIIALEGAKFSLRGKLYHHINGAEEGPVMHGFRSEAADTAELSSLTRLSNEGARQARHV
jgi:hypothetical protein